MSDTNANPALPGAKAGPAAPTPGLGAGAKAPSSQSGRVAPQPPAIPPISTSRAPAAASAPGLAAVPGLAPDVEEDIGPAEPVEPTPEELQLAERLAQARETLADEVHKLIVGQDEVIEQLLISVFCRGHCLMVGVPGLAKTAIVNTLARALRLSFSRVQFTPDLMPSDITGTDIIQEDPETGRRQAEFLPGPIFKNLILADEINRTPPKTQAALLEAMQEHRVTVGNKTYRLPQPFFVLATQNPIEQEGTYPLPEAQLDRFMFLVKVGYPSREEEIQIMRRTTTAYEAKIQPVFSEQELQGLQEIVRKVPVSDHVYGFAVDLVRATRISEPYALPEVKRWLEWGSGPRASQYLLLGAKARALLHGRFHATTDDIAAIAKPVLRHRLVLNFAAESEGLTTDAIVDRVLEALRPGK